MLKIRLLQGNTHCSNGILDDLKLIIPKLKNLGVKIRFVADSGYDNKKLFEFLNQNQVEFLIAQKQFSTVKKLGKWAKNRQLYIKYKAEIKDRGIKYGDAVFKQVYVRVAEGIDKKGQLHFVDYLAEDFTNVFVTNMDLSSKALYRIYREHAQVEVIIGELKQDYGVAKSRGDELVVNQSFAQLIGIAFNLKTTFARKILGYTENVPTTYTFRNDFLHTPGYFANHSGKLQLKTLTFGFKKMISAWNALEKLQPMPISV